MKFFPTTTLTGSLLSAGISYDLRNGARVPDLKSVMNFFNESTDKVSIDPLYVNFFMFSAGSRILKVGSMLSSTPMNSASLY